MTVRPWALAIHLALKEAEYYNQIDDCSAYHIDKLRPVDEFLMWAYQKGTAKDARTTYEADKRTNTHLIGQTDTEAITDEVYEQRMQQNERNRAKRNLVIYTKYDNAKSIGRLLEADFLSATPSGAGGSADLTKVRLEDLRKAIIHNNDEPIRVRVLVTKKGKADKFVASELGTLQLEMLALTRMTNLPSREIAIPMPSLTEEKANNVLSSIPSYRIELPLNWRPLRPPPADAPQVIEALETCATSHHVLSQYVAKMRSKMGSGNVAAAAAAEAAAEAGINVLIPRRKSSPPESPQPKLDGGDWDSVFPF